MASSWMWQQLHAVHVARRAWLWHAAGSGSGCAGAASQGGEHLTRCTRRSCQGATQAGREGSPLFL